MSDYCQQCSHHVFGEDFRELAGNAGYALCEGCGEMVQVDAEGKRMDGRWLAPHSAAWDERMKRLAAEDA